MPVSDLNLTDKQKDATNRVKEDYRDSANQKADYMRKSIDLVRHYNQFIPKPRTKEGERRARLANPQGFSVVEHATAKMKQTIYPVNPSTPIARALPTEPNDVDRVPSVELLSNYQMRRINIRYKGEMWLRNFNLFGIAPIFCYWDRRLTYGRTVRLPDDRLNPLTGRLERVGLYPPIKIPEPLLEFNGPNFKVINVEDFFPDPAARAFTSDEMRWCIVIWYMSWDQLVQMAKSNEELYDLSVINQIPKDDTPPIRDNDTWSNEITRFHWTNVDLNYRSQMKGMIEIKFWCSCKEFIMIANDEYPILKGGVMDNPYWDYDIPVICPVRLPISNYPWGKGHVEPLDQTLKYMNALRNANLDRINLELNPPWFLQEGVFDKDQFRNVYPNKLIELPDLDSAKPMPFAMSASEWHIQEGRLLEDIETISSLIGVNTGRNPENARNTGQILTLIELASERLQMDIDSFISQGQVPLHRKFHNMTQMFLTEPELVRISNEEGFGWKWVSPQEITGEFDFYIDSGARVTPKVVEAQQRMLFLQSVAPAFQGFPDLLIDLYRVAAKDFGYLTEADHLKKLMAVIAQKREEMGGMIGGNGAQELQGARGNEGANTAPGNTPAAGDVDGLVNQVLNGGGIEPQY